MRPWNRAGGVRLPKQADCFPDSFHGLALSLPRRHRGGMYATPHRVTRETSMRAGLASRLVADISESEVRRPAYGGVGAGRSSHDGKDSITFSERRTRALGMLRREGKNRHESFRVGGGPCFS